MTIDATAPTAGLTYPSHADVALTSMSADSLLVYCQGQLDGLDGEISDRMNAQKLKLKEREALENVQQVLGSYGAAGPDGAGFDRCLAAIDNAAGSLDAGDPVRSQLEAFRSQIIGDYDYKPPAVAGGLTPGESATLRADLQKYGTAASDLANSRTTPDDVAALASQLQQLSAKEGSLGNPPTQDNQRWKATTATLDTYVGDIKSDAEIDMLKLQDLVSQRQQAVQLCSGMMGKTDQTLEDQAKAIGR